jgi:hypothetical protein
MFKTNITTNKSLEHKRQDLYALHTQQIGSLALAAAVHVWDFRYWLFRFVSSFDIRISNLF